MKIKHFAFFLITALFYLSCGGVSQSGQGSISVDAASLARSMARDMNWDDMDPDMERFADMYTMSMTIKLSTIGTYSASAEQKYKMTQEEMKSGDEEYMANYFMKSMGKPLTIDNIPVGSRIKVKAEVSFGSDIDEALYKEYLKMIGYPDEYIELDLAEMRTELSGKMSVCEGYSEEFTVKEGPNSATVKMYDVDFDGFGEKREKNEKIEFPIMLYSNVATVSVVAEEYKISMKLNDTKTLLVEATDTTYPYIDYCTDNNGYYYVLCYISSSPKIYSNNPALEDGFVTLPSDVSSPWKAIAYDPVKNKLYGYWTQEAHVKITCFSDLISSGNVATSVEGETSYTGDSFLNYVGEIPYFAVYDDTVYVARRFLDDTGSKYPEALRIYKSPLSEISNLPAGVASMEDDGEFFIDLYNQVDERWLSIEDMVCIGGYLYVIVNKENSPITNLDNGGIMKILLSDPHVYDTLVSDSRALTVSYRYGDTDEEHEFTFRQPAKEEATTGFFTPKRFIGIAIEPKKLVIADDGRFFYADSSKKGYFKNINRAVLVDLDHFAITGVQLTDEIFEGEVDDVQASYTPYQSAFTSAD